jgi:hypothetical protein
MADEFDDKEDVSPVEDTSDLASESDAAAAGAPEPSAAAPAASPMNPILQDYLKSKQNLAAAQQQANRNSMLSGLARAGAFLSAGITGSNAPVNQSPFDQLDREADAPVQNVLSQQKVAGQELANKQALSQAVNTASDNDPNSPQSIAKKELIKKLYPGKYDDATLASLSAAQIDTSIMKPLELDQKIQEAKQKTIDRQQDRADAAAEKDDAAKDKAYTSMRKDLESFRGNQSAQQAALKIQNADTALAIVKNKDPNSLTTQDLTLLADEMEKLATGGVATEGGVKALMPNNLQTKFAEMKNFLLSKPTDAQAGDYIRHNMQYLEEMKNVAQGTLKSYRTNLAKGYKNRVKKEDFDEAMSDYGLGDDSSGLTPTPSESTSPSGIPGVTPDAIAAEKARRAAAKAQQQQAPPTPTPMPTPSEGPEPSGLNGYAYGGMINGLPASNYAAEQMRRPVAVKPVRLPPVRHFTQGGTIPGRPMVNHNDPRNDVVPVMATPKEVVLPLSVTQAKDPAVAAYIYMKHLAKGK